MSVQHIRRLHGGAVHCELSLEELGRLRGNKIPKIEQATLQKKYVIGLPLYLLMEEGK